MKKRASLLVGILLCMTAVLSGCSLFPINNDLYFSEIIATIDSDIKIDREELLIAFSNYGETLINNYQMTKKEAMDKTLELVINKQIMLRKSRAEFGTLNEKETSKLWHDTYSAVNKNLQEFESKIIVEEGLKPTFPIEKEVDSKFIYKKHEKQATIGLDAKGEVVITLPKEEDKLKDVVVIEGGAKNFVQEITTASLSKKAKESYIRTLKKNEDGRTFKGTDAYSDDAVFSREIERIYENFEDNYFLEKLQDKLKNKNEISPKDVAEKYRDNIMADYTKYLTNHSAYEEDMKSSSSKVVYNANYEENDNYFFVSHILVKFDKKTEELVKTLKTKKEQGYISQTEYDLQLKDLAQKVSGKKRVDGKEAGDAVDISLIKNEILNAVNAAEGNDKAIEFGKLVSAYNQDDGVFSSDYPYVIGEKNSQMVKTFTDAARLLNTNGAYGAISEIVPSEFGAHILIYLGKAENKFNVVDPNNFSLSEKDVLEMTEILVNPLTGKTMFDVVYESLVKDNYSVFEGLYVSQLKKNVVINVNKTKLEKTNY